MSSLDAALDIVFAGNPEFAVPSLEALASSRHRVRLVIAAPSRRAGRGLQRVVSPVHSAAERLGLPVDQVDARDRRALLRCLEAVSPDVLVVVAWGGMIPRKVLQSPGLTALNVHASLLPRWRGAAPVERAIMAGDSLTGVTIMYMAAGLDEGDIMLQRELPLDGTETGGGMRGMLAAMGADLLVQAVELLAAGKAPRRPQGEAGVTWAPKLTPADERISWEMAADVIDRVVRALSPSPGAHFGHAGTLVKLLAGRVATAQPLIGAASSSGSDTSGITPGTIIGLDADSLVVATGQRAYLLDRVKPAGSREMTGAGFARGRRLGPGDRLAE